MLPAGDQNLVQILDLAFADAARRSGNWLVCRPGCAQCCIGVFAIHALDAARLQAGLAELADRDPARARAVERRARDSVKRLAPGFPGDPSTGVLDPSSEAQDRFEDFANDEPCPALDPATNLCDLYEHRPVACRVFGPPVRSQSGPSPSGSFEPGTEESDPTEGLGICELCYHGATPEQIAACEMEVDPDGLEAQLLGELREGPPAGRGPTDSGMPPGEQGLTLVAFALSRGADQQGLPADSLGTIDESASIASNPRK
jgi:Fe-S-cluster containining protein